jgi:hypothetical protein
MPVGVDDANHKWPNAADSFPADFAMFRTRRVFDDVLWVVEDLDDSAKIQAVLGEVRLPLRRIPLEPQRLVHGSIIRVVNHPAAQRDGNRHPHLALRRPQAEPCWRESGPTLWRHRA